MLTAAEAAKRLGISPATLYAYVSRGLIRSVRDPKNPRNRLYSVEDVERRRPANAAERALDWGGPVLESAITLISGGHRYYGGQEVSLLGLSRFVGGLALFIFTGNMYSMPFAFSPLHFIAGHV